MHRSNQMRCSSKPNSSSESDARTATVAANAGQRAPAPPQQEAQRQDEQRDLEERGDGDEPPAVVSRPARSQAKAASSKGSITWLRFPSSKL